MSTRINVILAAPQLEDDRATAITIKWAEQLKEAISHLEHIVLVPFLGKDAVREKIEPFLKKDIESRGIFVFIDHGESDKLTGSDDQPLIDTDNIGMLKNKFVYAVACKSASKLGYEALKKGVAGYIGFNDNFQIWVPATNLIFVCFLSGIMEMIENKKPAIDAREKVENEIRRYIHKLRAQKKISRTSRKYIISVLRHNFNSMVCLGDWKWKIE